MINKNGNHGPSKNASNNLAIFDHTVLFINSPVAQYSPFLYYIAGVVVPAASIDDSDLISNTKHQQQKPIDINFPHGYAPKP